MKNKWFLVGAVLQTSLAAANQTTIRQSALVPASASGYSAAVALLSIGDKFHTGIQGKWESPLDPTNPYVMGGAQTGFLIGPSSPTSWIVPLQGVLTYNFDQTKGMAPYLGLAMGLSVIHTGEVKVDLPTYTVGGMTIGGGSMTADSGGTHVKFAGAFRAGLRFGENAYAELPIGSLGGALSYGISAGLRL